MSTLRQIEANRRNSQKSTGPRTPEGKAASRFNALKTGIHAQSHVIPGEDPAELEQLTTEYHQQFCPSTATERFLVDSLVHADWQLRRLRKAETQLWNHEIKDASRSVLGRGLDEACPLGHVFARSREDFLRMHRILQAAERTYFRALKELSRLQTADSRADSGELPSDSVPAPEPLAPQIGFVPPDLPDPFPEPAARRLSFEKRSVPPPPDRPSSLWGQMR